MKNILISLLASTLLIGNFCGIASAETSSASNAQARVFPVKDAFVRYHKAKHSHDLSALNFTQQKMTLSWTDGPGPVTTFQGTPAVTFVSNYKNGTNGKVNYTAVDTEYFSASDFAPLGTEVTISGSRGVVKRYSVLTAKAPLPKTARVGDSGSFADIVGYSDSSKAKIVDRRMSTWKLEPDPQASDRAIFCISDIIAPTATPDIVQTAMECFHEDTAGNFTAPFEIDGSSTRFH